MAGGGKSCSDLRSVAIVTGFFVPDADVPAAETDGPPARSCWLRHSKRSASAALSSPIVSANRPYKRQPWPRNSPPACRGLPRETGPGEHSSAPIARFEEFVKTERGSQLTHMIAIERVGPSHDERSLSTQRRAGAAPLAEFLAKLHIATVATTPAEN